MFIWAHFCLGVSRVSVRIFTYWCVFVCSLPLLLHLFLTGNLQADWIGYTSHFLLHPPISAVFLSLLHVPLCNGTKSLLGMALRLLAHFVSSSSYFECFWNKVFGFIFLFVYYFHFFLGYQRWYRFDITPNDSLQLFSSLFWVLKWGRKSLNEGSSFQLPHSYNCIR